MAKNPAMKKNASGKRRFEGGGSTATDILRDALATRPSSSGGNLVPRSSKTSLDAPKGRSVAKRGSTSVAKPGRPTIDVDARTRPGEKLAGQGSGIKTAPKALPAPSAASAAATGARASRLGMLGRGLAGTAGIGALALMPDTKREAADADKPRDYPGEGLKARAAFPQGSPESSIPAPKKAAPKPVARKPRASADDDFMADLRASAARMKDATSEAARDTGRMKGAMEEFQSAADDATDGYKRGGRVGGRGDGKAMRGRTKGRFI